MRHATFPSFCPAACNSSIFLPWAYGKFPACFHLEAIPDRLPQCMLALAKARLYKMTGPDPSMKHKMVFRLGPLHAPCNFSLLCPAARNSSIFLPWAYGKFPACFHLEAIPDRLPQCMPALAKARLYKMTGLDPSMNHKMVFRLGPLHEAHFMVHGRVRPCHFIVERMFCVNFCSLFGGPKGIGAFKL